MACFDHLASTFLYLACLARLFCSCLFLFASKILAPNQTPSGSWNSLCSQAQFPIAFPLPHAARLSAVAYSCHGSGVKCPGSPFNLSLDAVKHGQLLRQVATMAECLTLQGRRSLPSTHPPPRPHHRLSPGHLNGPHAGPAKTAAIDDAHFQGFGPLLCAYHDFSST